MIVSLMKSFIENSENKIDLNNLISEYAARETTWQWGREGFVTFGKTVKSTLYGPVDIICDLLRRSKKKLTAVLLFI